MFVYLSGCVCLSVCICLCLYVCLSVSVCLSGRVCVLSVGPCLYVHLSVCLWSVFLSFSICYVILFVSWFILLYSIRYLSVCLPVCFPVCLIVGVHFGLTTLLFVTLNGPFSLYVLFTPNRSCNSTLENCFLLISSYSRAPICTHN